MVDTVHGLLQTRVADADAVINRLKQEVDTLRLMLEAKHVEQGTGIFTAAIPITLSMAQVDRLLQRWRELWAERQVSPPPPLMPIIGGVEIAKVEYEGFGMFVIRVPHNMKMDTAQRISQVWEAVWKRSGTQNVPMVILPADIDIEKMTDIELQVLGLMRIPTALSAPG